MQNLKRILIFLSAFVLSSQSAFAGRYYDATTGRFITVDKLAHKLPGVTPYNYGLNNPLKFIDPDGQFPYTFHVRAFAPTGAFRGWGFHDDRRGFSSNTNVSSRINQSFTVDPSARTFSGGQATSDPTFWNGLNVGRATSTGSASATFGSNSAGSGTAAVLSKFSGSNPALQGVAPNIEVSSAIGVTENLKAGKVFVSIDLSSKQFPATEALISDNSGQTIFLGGGPALGSPLDLLSADQQQISSLDITIGINSEGVFQNISFNGQTYSIADWNKLMSSRSAGPMPREDQNK